MKGCHFIARLVITVKQSSKDALAIDASALFDPVYIVEASPSNLVLSPLTTETHVYHYSKQVMVVNFV